MSPARRGGSRLERGPSPYVFALAGIALVALASYIAFWHHVPLTSRGYSLHAVMSNSAQIQPGSPVRVAGVDVGRVSRVARGPDHGARITLSIDDRGLPLHTDATLKIRPRLFLEGSLYVELRPGSPSAPTLRSGSTLPATQTSFAVQMDQLLSTLDTPARESLKGTVAAADRALAGGGAQGLRRATRALPPLLRQVALISDAAQGASPRDLSAAIRGAARVTDALARDDAALSRLVANARTTTATLADHDDAIARTLTELDRLERELPAVLERTDPAVAALRTLAGDLRPAFAVMPRPLRHAADLLDQASALSRGPELPRLLRYLAPTLRRAPGLERGLRRLLPIVGRVTECANRQVLPVLTSTVDDGPLSTHRPVWQDLAHVSVQFVGAAQNFDGNGSALRVAAALGDTSVALGALPGSTQLAGHAPTPVIGARPLWMGPGVTPPFRPDQDCSKQAPVDLSPATAAAAARAARGGRR